MSHTGDGAASSRRHIGGGHGAASEKRASLDHIKTHCQWALVRGFRGMDSVFIRLWVTRMGGAPGRFARPCYNSLESEGTACAIALELETVVSSEEKQRTCKFGEDTHERKASLEDITSSTRKSPARQSKWT